MFSSLFKKSKTNAKETIKSHIPGEGIASKAKDTSSLFRAVNFELFAKPNLKVAVPGTILFVACFGYVMHIKYQAGKAIEKGTHFVQFTEQGKPRMGLTRGNRWD